MLPEYTSRYAGCMTTTKEFIYHLLANNDTVVKRCYYDEVEVMRIPVNQRQAYPYYYIISCPHPTISYYRIMLCIFSDSVSVSTETYSHMVDKPLSPGCSVASSTLWDELHNVLDERIELPNLVKFDAKLLDAMKLTGYDRIRKLNNLLV